MVSRVFRQTALIGLILLATLSVGQSAPKPPGQHLSITEVSVIFGPPDIIVIKGEDFDFGSPLDVALGEFGSLFLTSASGTEIIADLPVNIPDGDYLLTVSTGNGQSQNDEYDLTIGAVGPQGEQGPQGPQGPPGLSGYEQVSNQTTNPGNLGSGSVFSVVAQCPGGKKVLGGGIRLSGQASVLADLRVFESQPSSSMAWRAAAILVGPPNPPAGSATLKAFAVCAFAN